MSFYAIHARPDVFSKAGIFSPAFWYSPESFEFASQQPLAKSAKVGYLVGTKEGEGMVNNMQQMLSLLTQSGHPRENIKSAIVEGAEHNEAFWSSQFGEFVLWLFGED